MSKKRIGLAAFALYVFTVWAANYFITHVGHVSFPGGPHTIPVGFGYDAPSGVLWIGLALLVRDVVQTLLGKRAVVGGILLGAALSYIVAPSLAVASAVAFLLSESLDFVVYTPLIERSQKVKITRTYHGIWGEVARSGRDVPPEGVTERRESFVDRRYVLAAVVASNTVGAVVDTFLFLWIAFGSIQFWQGQIIGKLLVTVAVIPVLAWLRRDRRSQRGLVAV